MNEIGSYKGLRWRRRRVCEVIAVDSRRFMYFVVGDDGKFTGDSFDTLGELKRWVDSLPRHRDANY